MQHTGLLKIITNNSLCLSHKLTALGKTGRRDIDSQLEIKGIASSVSLGFQPISVALSTKEQSRNDLPI